MENNTKRVKKSFYNCNSIGTQFTTKKQLKYLTYNFVFESHVINFRKKACSFMFSHSNTCAIWVWAQKKLTLKEKIIIIIIYVSLIHFVLCFPTYLPT
jgi:hypothetical protein